MSPIKVDIVVEEGKTKSTNFRRMLLAKCQQEFEKDKQDDDTLEEMHKRITQAETVSADQQQCSREWCLSAGKTGGEGPGAEGRTVDSHDSYEETIAWKHQIHWRTFQAEDAVRDYHA